jgi:hypothetical protein
MFKYQTELKKVNTSKVPCPPASAKQMHGEAWRWVRNPIDAGCFAPVAEKNPPRLLRAQKDGPTQECSCWGLSMHSTKPQSIKAFQELEKNISNARKIFGGFVSGATLSPTHGEGTSPTSNGHFDLHPYKDVDFLIVFVAFEAIP